MFLEQRRRISRFAPNPFEKRRDTIREGGSYSLIKGIDPFPSQTALMEMAEYLPKQVASTSNAGKFEDFCVVGSLNSFLRKMLFTNLLF